MFARHAYGARVRFGTLIYNIVGYNVFIQNDIFGRAARQGLA